MKKYILILILLLLLAFSCDAKDQIQSKEKVNSKNIQAGGDIRPDATVSIKNFSFQPPTLTVSAGTTVTWHNQDGTDHTITSDTGLFDSGVVNPGKKFSFGFDAPGSYSYHCSIHPNMQGKIIVTEPESAALSMPTTSEIITPELAGSGAKSQQGETSSSLSETALIGQIPSKGPKNQVKGLQPNINQDVGQIAGLAGSGTKIPPGKTSPSWSETTSSSQMPIKGPKIQVKDLQLNVNVNQDVSQSQVMQYSQYYQITPEPPSHPLTAPAKYEIRGQEPTTLYFGASQKAVPYSQYQTYAMTLGMNSLWIQGATSWTQYAVVPQGASLSMIAMSPSGGYGYLYEVYPDGTLDKNGYEFYPYDQIGFYADQVGQHLLFFVVNGQPSNIVTIDVVPYQPQASVTISSDWLRGYDVYVDGNYQGTEGLYGQPPGRVIVTVPGSQYHTIAVYGSGFSYSDSPPKFFNAGWAYTLNV